MTDLGSRYTEELEQHGFRPREAEFLYLIGTQTGVFTAKQWGVYRSGKRGNLDQRLINQLTQLHLCYVTPCGQFNLVMLATKRFYRLIGQEDSRLRRGASAPLLRQRLLYTDYLASNPHIRCLNSTSEKVRFFTETMGMPLSILPQRPYTSKDGSESTTVYFPDRFPIFVEEGSTPLVGVCYGEDPRGPFEPFRKFLLSHRDFLSQIPKLHFVYISPLERRRELAEQLLSTVLSAQSDDHKMRDIHRYFRLRLADESGRLSAFQADDFAFWQSAQSMFTGHNYEEMYQLFRDGKDFSLSPCARIQMFSAEFFAPFSHVMQVGVSTGRRENLSQYAELGER